MHYMKLKIQVETELFFYKNQKFLKLTAIKIYQKTKVVIRSKLKNLG